MAPLDNKTICAYWFTKDEDDPNKHVCRCGTIMKQVIAAGYTNLMTHLRKQHNDFEEQVNAAQRQCTLFGYTNKASNIHAWLTLLILNHWPFSTVTSESVRKYIKLSPISRNSLMKYHTAIMEIILDEVKKIVTKQPVYGLYFDGWSDGNGRHYLGIYLVCATGKFLLSHTLLLDETNQNATNNVATIKDVLQFFDLDLEKCQFCCSDNTNVCPAIARGLGKPLIGCKSHLFNLAVKEWIRDNHAELVEKVQQISLKLLDNNPAGKLRGCTPLKPKKVQLTRWSGTMNALTAYNKIKEFITVERFPEFAELMLKPDDHVALVELLESLGNLHSITKELQRETLTMGQARCLFDAAIELVPTMEHYLSAEADLVTAKSYENGLVKLSNGTPETLTVCEAHAVRGLVVAADADSDVEQVEDADGAPAPVLSFAAQALKRVAREQSRAGATTTYYNTDWINPTSNIVERLFSQSKLEFSPHRRSMMAGTLEHSLLLRFHLDLLTVHVVGRALDMLAGTNVEEEEEA